MTSQVLGLGLGLGLAGHGLGLGLVGHVLDSINWFLVNYLRQMYYRHCSKTYISCLS